MVKSPAYLVNAHLTQDPTVESTDRKTLPFVSVIMPVRNEEARIHGCLEQIRHQSYPSDRLEVIIADGQSTDRTVELIKGYPRSAETVRVIEVESLGRSQGLNAAIEASKGDVVLRLDARTVIGCDYIERCVQTLQQTGADNVGGQQSPLWTTPKQQAIGLASSHPFGVGNARFRLGGKSGFVDTVYLGCFWRKIFDQIGSFDESAAVISEDSELNQRILQAGGKVYYNCDIVAGYYPRERFRDQWNTYFRYGGARVGNFLKHGQLTSWRQLAAPLFILVNLLSGALGVLHPVFWLLLLAVDLAYVCMNTFVSARLACAQRDGALFPMLWIAFPCMHLAWGLGFWKRLLVRDRPGFHWPN